MKRGDPWGVTSLHIVTKSCLPKAGYDKCISQLMIYFETTKIMCNFEANKFEKLANSDFCILNEAVWLAIEGA